MILEAVNDRQCLDQLTKMAREIARTTLVQNIARRLGSKKAVDDWLQSLPQTDDDGADDLQGITCDVWQRVRLFPPDPNCVERAFAAMVLYEALDQLGLYRLVTIEKPARHTAFVANDEPVDLFPRRNFNWTNFGKDVLKGTHDYVGKPVLKFYLGDTGGQVADALGGYEDKLTGTKTPPPKTAAAQQQQPARRSPPPPNTVGSSAAQRPTEPVFLPARPMLPPPFSATPVAPPPPVGPSAPSAPPTSATTCHVCTQGGMTNANESTSEEEAPGPIYWPPAW